MEYEEFITTEKSDQCICVESFRIAILIVTVIEVFVSFYKICKSNRKIDELQIENQSLRRKVMRNIDEAFVNIMKNGNQFDDTHED
jgi:hypothetical protein